MLVFDVYEGDPTLHSKEITVRIPGGRVEFDGGRLWAEAHIAGLTPPLNQDELILFLRPYESEEKLFSITFSRQGLFQVTPDRRVIPAATSWSPVSQTSKRDYGEFIKQLGEAVGELKRD